MTITLVKAEDVQVGDLVEVEEAWLKVTSIILTENRISIRTDDSRDDWTEGDWVEVGRRC